MPMSIVKKLMSQSTLALALAVASAGAATTAGCMAHGQYGGALVVRSEPPPPRSTYVEPRPGYVWVDGRWGWDDYSNEWVWYDGYWVEDRPGYYYVAGRWENRGDRYVWTHPRWVNRTNASVQMRVTDHSRPTRVRIRENTGRRIPHYQRTR
jgi:hypothetical protein